MTARPLPCPAQHRAEVRALLDAYLGELSAWREVSIGATNAESYRWFDGYWSESGRHPFLIRQSRETAGFAFVRTPASTGSAASQIAEFYISPPYRRGGVGGAAALEIFRLFPGPWELQMHGANTGAMAFWRALTAEAVAKPPVIAEISAADGRRLQFNFAAG